MSIVSLGSLEGSGELAKAVGEEGRKTRKEIKTEMKTEKKKQKAIKIPKYHNPNILTKHWWKILLIGGAGVGGYVLYNKFVRPIVGTAQAVQGIAGIPMKAISEFQRLFGGAIQQIKWDPFDVAKIFNIPKAVQESQVINMTTISKNLSEGFRDLKGFFPGLNVIFKADSNVKTDVEAFAFPVEGLLKGLDTLKQPFNIFTPLKTSIDSIVQPKSRSEDASNIIKNVTNLFTAATQTQPKIEFGKIPLFDFMGSKTTSGFTSMMKTLTGN